MATLLDLAKRLEAKLERIEQNASDRAVAAAKAILQDLVYVTPVDTSTALSNWQIGLGAPSRVFLPPYVPGRRGSSYAQSAEAAFAAGVAELSRKLPGQTIYISNVTPYIGDLNRGTSRQAPAGFVERAIIVGRNAAKNDATVRKV